MRSDINKQIQSILLSNKDLVLKKSLDHIKKQISEVLKLFKQSLEDKHAKKMAEMEKKVQSLKRQIQEIEGNREFD